MPEKFEGGVQPQEDAEKELIQPVLQVLKETAEKFRSLNQEAKEALQAKRDVATYRQKLEERAQLLISLPNRLSAILDRINPEKKQEIMRATKWFTTSAQEALDTNDDSFALGVLLTQRGGKVGDNNDLEKLIVTLEKKLSKRKM